MPLIPLFHLKQPEPKVACPSAGASVQLALEAALLELLPLPPPHPFRASVNTRSIIRFKFFILPTPLVKPSSSHYR